MSRLGVRDWPRHPCLLCRCLQTSTSTTAGATARAARSAVFAVGMLAARAVLASTGKNADLEDMIKAAKRPAAKRPAATASKPATSKPVTGKAATSSAKGPVANASTSKAPPKELANPGTPQVEQPPEPVPLQAPPKELANPGPPQVEQQPESVPSQALRPEPVVGSVRVRYNHYNSAFNLSDGTLQWSDVDEEYCISYVFKGAFRPRLLDKSRAYFERDAAGCFAGLHDGGEYTLVVEEDEAAEAAATAADPRRAAGVRAAEPVMGVNAASSRITAELKTLSVEELAGQSDRYRALKEARDLEDVLYSGT